MTNHRQLTIREFLLLVVFVAVGVAGLTTGGLFASLVIGVAIVVTTAIAIVAFVGRNRLRFWAIGFLIPVIVYASTVLAVGSSELDPYGGKLPTTKLLQPLFELVVKREYVNLITGDLVPDYDPATNAGSGGGGFAGSPISMSLETPDRTTFFSLGHVLLAMICGYAGAKFAVWIDRGQSTERRPLEPPAE